MNADFGRLVELQNFDLQIHELVVSAQEFPAQVSDMESQLGAATEQSEQLKNRLEEIDKEKGATLATVQEAEQAAERSQERLATIRTNREYDALHMELEANQSNIRNGKARIEALDSERTQVEEAITESQTQLENLKGDLEPRITELKSKIAAIDGQKAEIQTKRDAVAAEVPPQYLRTYEHIQKRRKSGQALSYVDNAGKTCAVCHMVLQPQLVNELRAERRLNLCQSCGSILLWRDDEMQAPGDAS
jgi:predicted  nucleic acid-binding Zn-ribbon protein